MHLRVFSPQGELLARMPKEGDLNRLLAAFGYNGSEAKVEHASGKLLTTQSPRPAVQDRPRAGSRR